MILVTGATGFLGSELVRQLLLGGEKVRAIKREQSEIPPILQEETNIDWRDADLLDYFQVREAMEGVTQVYHCAAFISFDPADRRKIMQVNIEGTAHLLSLSLDNRVSKFIHVSSVAAIGQSKGDALATEMEHWEFGKGQSSYSISKYESEMEVFRANAEGLPIVIVNPGIIIGKNCGDEGSGKLIQAVRKGLNYYPAGSFGYVDVEDVARVMIRLMESDVEGERFILIAENWTYKEFFQETAIQLGKRPPSFPLRPWMMKLAYLGSRFSNMFSGRKYELNPETIRSASRKRSFSNEKIKRTLNFEFKPLRQSIAEICKS